jgi:hypothetical protein
MDSGKPRAKYRSLIGEQKKNPIRILEDFDLTLPL